MLDSPSVSSRPSHGRSLWLFWVLTTLLAEAVCGGFYYREASQVEKTLREREEGRVTLFSQVFGNDFANIVANLHIIADSHDLQDYLMTGNPVARERLGAEMASFSKRHKIYDQVRLLNEHGHEVVRVDADGQLLADDQLQDKSDRSYFQKTMTLEAGDIYISPFNLNVENGQVELPYKPMLRFAMPVNDSRGRKRGVVVINLLGTHLLSFFEKLAPSYQHRLRLLNADGYWLRAARPEMEWGFQVPGRAHFNVAQTAPELWQRLSTEPTGQAHHADGLFTWSRMAPAGFVGNSTNAQAMAGDAFLVLASEINSAEWSEAFAALKHAFVYLGLLSLGLTTLSTAILRNRRKTVEKLHAADHLRAIILRNVGAAVIACDAKGTIVSFNETAEKWLGWSANELIGRVTPSVFHDPVEVRARAKALSQELGRTIEPGFEAFVAKARIDEIDPIEWTYVHRDGKRFPVSLTVTALRDSRGNITGFLGVATDMTERKRIEEALRAARDSAQESARMKSQFLANMSHEIRTPMNGVVGMAGLLLDTELSPEQRSYTNTIRTSADSLLNIINDILDFSKIEAGMLTFEELPFDLRDPVESCLALVADKAHAKGLELAYLIEEAVPVNLLGDAGRLHQVMLNLVGNAVKFTPQGEIVLRVVKLGVNEAERRTRLKFSIKDTGIGIPPAAQKKLFQPFTQADGSTTRRFGGTGLGLAISKQLVTMMHGEIGVESTEGQGTTFWFTIELAQQAAAPKVVPHKARLAGLQALVVDDNATNREILQNQLSRWECHTVAVASGKEALAIQARNSGPPFNFAIIDMQMPEMDGLELAGKLRSGPEGANLKILILSSMGHLLKQNELAAAGVDASLMKPVRQAQLHDTLISCLGRRSAVPFASSTPASAPQSPPTADVKPLRILLAEDNLVNQHVARLQLSKFGYQVDVVGDGQAALDAVRKQRYDLILMDCQMPELDGYESTRRIRDWETEQRDAGKQDEPIYIIAMTANAMAGDRDACIDAGMNDYVSKPVRAEDLAAAIARAPATSA